MRVYYIFNKTCMEPCRVIHIIKDVGDMEWCRCNIVCKVTFIKVLIAAIENFPRFGANRRVAAPMMFT